jgi:hypothetical protein
LLTINLPLLAPWGKKPPYPADMDAAFAMLFSGRELVFTAEGSQISAARRRPKCGREL